jgi:hypothetical protein
MERVMNEQKPKSTKDPLFYEGLQPEDGKLSQAQQARRDQIALAARAKLASLSERLKAARPKPEPEPEREPEHDEEHAKGAVLHALPAVIPPRPLPATWDDLLTVMNNQHAIIDNVGGKTVIASWEPSPIDPSRQMVVFHNKDSFILRYSNKFAKITITNKSGATVEVEVPVGHWWLNHPDRQQYRGITFQPNAGRAVNDCLNLWRDWGCKPRKGDWSLIRKHIEEVLADRNPEFAGYIIRWIAWAIQNPDKRAEVALVLIGEKGSGKGTLVRVLEVIFGQHLFQVSSSEEVVGRFNSHLEDCILFVADEAYWGGDKRCVGKLQTQITEPMIPIEHKGINRYLVRNMLHHLMIAEPGWVIPAGRFERRYAAITVSKARLGDKAYFDALYAQIANGGAEAMFYDLLRMDLKGWHPRQLSQALLSSAALQKQQRFTLPPLEQWYLGLLHSGRLPMLFGKPPKLDTAYTRSLVDDARDSVPRLRSLSDVAMTDFLAPDDINESTIGIVCTKHRDASRNGWTFPPLAECREAWSKCYGPTKWDTDVVDWDEPKAKAKPKAKPEVAPVEAVVEANVVEPVVAVRPAGWRRF